MAVEDKELISTSCTLSVFPIVQFVERVAFDIPPDYCSPSFLRRFLSTLRDCLPSTAASRACATCFIYLPLVPNTDAVYARARRFERDPICPNSLAAAAVDVTRPNKIAGDARGSSVRCSRKNQVSPSITKEPTPVTFPRGFNKTDRWLIDAPLTKLPKHRSNAIAKTLSSLFHCE